MEYLYNKESENVLKLVSIKRINYEIINPRKIVSNSVKQLYFWVVSIITSVKRLATRRIGLYNDDVFNRYNMCRSRHLSLSPRLL